MTALAADISAPKLDYGALAPMLIVFGVAALGVLLEAFTPEPRRKAVQVPLTLVGLAAAFAAVLFASNRIADTSAGAIKTAAGAIAIDRAGLFLQGAILVLAAIAVLLIADRTFSTEIYPLAMFAIAGMLLFVTANDLLLMFVALEVLSLPLYLMCGLARHRRLISQEAAVKYFLLGAFASAFFLYGVALLYGYAGAVDFASIHKTIGVDDKNETLLLAGLAMLAIGLLFKAGLAPFHSWTPDVYAGAPTPVTAFMAACTKVAAFGALLRVLYVGFGETRVDWRPTLVAIAILTMLVGSIFAVTQTDIKRLLAYSSIANAGFILTGALAMTSDGVSSTLFYLVAYGFTTIGAFAVVMLVRDADGEATHLKRWAGLGRRAPLVAAVMTFFMLAFAGIPLTSGFTSKFAVFSAALGDDVVAPVIIGVIASMALAFPYLRLVVLMYLSEPNEQSADVHIPGGFTAAAITLGVLATLALGVAPQPLLDLTEQAAYFVR